MEQVNEWMNASEQNQPRMCLNCILYTWAFVCQHIVMPKIEKHQSQDNPCVCTCAIHVSLMQNGRCVSVLKARGCTIPMPQERFSTCIPNIKDKCFDAIVVSRLALCSPAVNVTGSEDLSVEKCSTEVRGSWKARRQREDKGNSV